MRHERKSFDRLSTRNAQDLFSAYVAGHPARLNALFSDLHRHGDLLDRLNFSRESLVDLWDWFLSTHSPLERPATDEAMRLAEPPWWYDFHAPLGQRLGPDIARLVTLIAAYLAETILRTKPGSEWILGSDPDWDGYNSPLLLVPNRGAFSPDGTLIVLGSQWTRAQGVSPNRLASIYDHRAGDRPSQPEAESSPFSIARGRPDDFDVEIVFDDVVAWEEEERIVSLVDALGRTPGVERAIHEDREIVLIRAPSIDDATIRATVSRLWDTLAPRSPN